MGSEGYANFPNFVFFDSSIPRHSLYISTPIPDQRVQVALLVEGTVSEE